VTLLFLNLDYVQNLTYHHLLLLEIISFTN